ncbi:NADH-quinone oxidoreductase subunit G [Chromatium weissei]|nr:NADH-quinone oxidoreductase subunit G [Chromatium weissei]
MTDKITIEINGRICEATPGEMIIAVADRVGISIPRFCYHKKLSVAANCRMCLVEAEQGGRPFPKPIPACATPVGNNMKVWTRSPKAIEAQQGTMEFLLINHPLDCPICDQGGECELQDVAIGYGDDISHFNEGKRVVIDENFGSLIATDMTRCIQCTRCVRFCAEIAGVRELGATGRGEGMRIGTFVAHAVNHELSGNIIDLCPVGALTSKPYRFTARAWELTTVNSIAPHDGIGSNIQLHIRRGQVMRVHPNENESINETWLSNRDRYSYTALKSKERLTTPMIKRDGIWCETNWSDALTTVAEKLKSTDPAAMGWLMSPTATLEELYLAQRIARELDCPNIDHRLRQQDFTGDIADPLLPWLGVSIAELEQQQGILLIGTDLRQEQPLIAHRIRKADLANGQIFFINPFQLELHHTARQLIGTPAEMVKNLAAIAKVLGISNSGIMQELINASEPNELQTAAATCLTQSGQQKQGLILMGAVATAHPNFTLLKAFAHAIADITNCKIGYLPAAANSVGAYYAGAHPRRLAGAKPSDQIGLTVAEMIEKPLKTLVLWGLEPNLDLNNPVQAMRMCEKADFVVACSAFRSHSLEKAADVLLPIAAFTETSGTYVNSGGTWQRFQGAVSPPNEARPGWKVLRVLGNLLDFKTFDYRDTAQIHDELAALCVDLPNNNLRCDFEITMQPVENVLMRVSSVPIHAVDSLVRRALPLQSVDTTRSNFGVYLHPDQAKTEKVSALDWVTLKQYDYECTAQVFIDHRIPLGCAYIPAGIDEAAMLGDQINAINLITTGRK